MFQSSSISGLQFILIGLGLLFQVVAVSALRREASSHRGHVPATEDEETPKVQATPSHTPAQEKIALPTLQQSRQRDYYEMEKTPTGVPAAELLRTARVTYFRN